MNMVVIGCVCIWYMTMMYEYDSDKVRVLYDICHMMYEYGSDRVRMYMIYDYHV